MFQITEDHKSPKFDPSPALAHRDTSRLLVVSYDHVIHWQSRDLSDSPKLYSVWLDRKQKKTIFLVTIGLLMDGRNKSDYRSFRILGAPGFSS
ncbi:hypothetical protein CDAR_481951 [Caerostris darwini]|uniref:Uncharacterized protein n=1 Tax=Caerostris darwini TaxID=1538125 RepID=A0AAV4TIR1_9ARAC|nr:hypothetical protein CDAR_481951 [Caerostris darwini]